MLNIVRFNWPMYVQGVLTAVLLGLAARHYPVLALPAAGAAYLVVASLVVSFYVYDLSNLYSLDYLPKQAETVTNLHAGFDETSLQLQQKYPHSHLSILDFFDPKKHTEPSILRARAFRPPLPQTERCLPAALPLGDASQDLVLCFMALHEMRDRAERVASLRELKRVLKGRLYVVEHQRDLANFLAFGPGFTHFHSPREWRENFRQADLELESEQMITPFVRLFVLR